MSPDTLAVHAGGCDFDFHPVVPPIYQTSTFGFDDADHGAALFAGGLWLNVSSDRALRRLRRPGETGYKIPRGGAFEWVSCPNYLGEVVEWTGWAIATWSLPGLAFAVYTAANLVPRALSHHAWYRREFPDYPRERRAVLPYLL